MYQVFRLYLTDDGLSDYDCRVNVDILEEHCVVVSEDGKTLKYNQSGFESSNSMIDLWSQAIETQVYEVNIPDIQKLSSGYMVTMATINASEQAVVNYLKHTLTKVISKDLAKMTLNYSKMLNKIR